MAEPCPVPLGQSPSTLDCQGPGHPSGATRGETPSGWTRPSEATPRGTQPPRPILSCACSKLPPILIPLSELFMPLGCRTPDRASSTHHLCLEPEPRPTLHGHRPLHQKTQPSGLTTSAQHHPTPPGPGQSPAGTGPQRLLMQHDCAPGSSQKKPRVPGGLTPNV